MKAIASTYVATVSHVPTFIEQKQPVFLLFRLRRERYRLSNGDELTPDTMATGYFGF
jgi:hypothetical protein